MMLGHINGLYRENKSGNWNMECSDCLVQEKKKKGI